MERLGFEPGTEVGGYEIVAPLGSGGMGTVYRALDADRRMVALKVLHPTVAMDPSARTRLRREIDILRRVNSPWVAKVLDAESDAEDLFIVTELIDGVTLEEEIQTGGALDATDLYELAEQLQQALRAVHGGGVVHRDLKASNVLISATGPVLIDFGIAQALGDARVTRSGLIMGTPAFLDPALVDGAEPSETSDWWSWAALLAYAATGRAPFGDRPIDLVMTRAKAGTPDLAGLGERTTAALLAALNPNPALRRMPEEVVAELRAVLDEGELLPAGAAPTAPMFAAEAADPTAPMDANPQDPYAPGHTRIMPVVVPDADADAALPVEGTAEAYAQPPLKRRSLSALALGLPIFAAGGLWPGRVLIVLLVLLLACRIVGTSYYVFQRRRELGGVRANDGLRAGLLAPWHAIRAALGLLPSVLIAATVVFTLGALTKWLLDTEKVVVGGDSNGPHVYQAVTLAAFATAAVLLWFGPLTSLTRLGGRVILEKAVPRGWPIAALWGISLGLTALLVQSLLGDPGVVWEPFPAPAYLG